MSRPVYSYLYRLFFLLLLAAVFFAGMLAGAGNGRRLTGKLQEAFPGWQERWAASREWIVGAGKKVTGFTGEVREVFARRARPSARLRTAQSHPPEKRRVFFPVLSWEKQELFPDRIGFTLPEKASVYAAAAGFVAELLPVKGGWRVRLDHDGEWSSFYYPLAGLAVARGEQVQPGEKLGHCAAVKDGETKLFWEVWRGGEAVPPRNLLTRRPVQETGK
ncbi:MAG: M23 family metallopeptidase [Firmicutes bacterium]|nr:M23 family metallopeptidase [Bacillota bacterium]